MAEFDAHGAATRLLGDAIYANMLLLGFAWQRGLVPVTADAMMKAIELNGAAVANNKKAFAWGRLAAEQPELVDSRSRAEAADGKPVETLDQLIARRVSYPDRLSERSLCRALSRLGREGARRPKPPRRPGFASLAGAVARNYFKLLVL